MKQIYLVRHGHCQALPADHEHRINPGLSERGRLQAQRLAQRLADIEFDRVLISPLRRAWQTWQISQVRAEQVEFDSRLVEIVPGYEQIIPVPTCEGPAPDRHNA